MFYPGNIDLINVKVRTIHFIHGFKKIWKLISKF